MVTHWDPDRERCFGWCIVMIQWWVLIVSLVWAVPSWHPPLNTLGILCRTVNSQFDMEEQTPCEEFPQCPRKKWTYSWSLALPALHFLDVEIMSSSAGMTFWVININPIFVNCCDLRGDVSALFVLILHVPAQRKLVVLIVVIQLMGHKCYSSLPCV